MEYDRARDLDTFEVNLEHHPGLSMRVRRPGFAGERALRKAWPVLTDARASIDTKATALELTAGALAGALVSWTLTMDGAPVPCTRRALCSLDTEFLQELVTVWVERVALRPPSADVELDDDADVDDMPPEPDDDPADGPFELDEEWLAQLPTTPPMETPAAVEVDPPAELEEVAV